MKRPRVLIIGAGFAGFHCARQLERKLEAHEAEVALVTPRNYLIYSPLLPQVAAGLLSPMAVAIPLRRTMHRTLLVPGAAIGLDLDARACVVRTITGETRVERYDLLVLAPGNVTRTFNIPGLERYARGMKMLAEADQATATGDLAVTARLAAEPPKLSRPELLAAQQQTLATPRRRYGIAARLLFTTMDLLYGRQRTLSKFKMLELIARVPYQSWEQVAYIAVTHVHRDPDFARRIHERIAESRVQQDNEQWHLLILEELLARSGKRESALKYYWVPQAIAFGYYQLSWLLYVIRPAWSYRLNADFEDHAEHEYMEFVVEHPGWETEPFESAFTDDYARFDSLADLFRQIGHDERVHKQESLAQATASRFR